MKNPVQVYGDPRAAYWFLQLTDGQDRAGMEAESREINARCPDIPFCLVPVPVEDWRRDLTPWVAPSFRGESFGDGAAKTLLRLKEHILPALVEEYSLPATVRFCLCGYSLAGLFALWSATRDHPFAGFVAGSPSLWYPEWSTYARDHLPGKQPVYLSLGDMEEKTRNPVMARVGNRVREEAALLEAAGVPFRLEWNPGNHFAETEKRMAKGISWMLKRFRKQELRQAFREKAANMTPGERASASEKIVHQLTELPSWREAKSVFLYWSLPSEPDTASLREAAVREGKKIFLPRCEKGGQMEAVPWTPDTPMESGAYGIPVPQGSPWQGTPDLVVVPCVSATADGVRLGHGAGYYDRYLAEHAAPAVCLCFRALLADALPQDEQDIRIPIVLTD